MNNALKTRFDSIVNGQILDFIERSYSSVLSLASTEPAAEVWDENSHNLTRFIQRLDEDQVLVVFRISRKILLGFSSKGKERGLIFSKDGHVREATDFELMLNAG